MYIDTNNYHSKKKRKHKHKKHFCKQTIPQNKFATKYVKFSEYKNEDYTKENVYKCLEAHNLWGALKIIKALNLNMLDFGIVNFVRLYLENGKLEAAFRIIEKHNISPKLINFNKYLQNGTIEELQKFLPATLTINNSGFAVPVKVDPKVEADVKRLLKNGHYKEAIYWITFSNLDPMLFKDHVNEDIVKYKEYDRAWMFIVELNLNPRLFATIDAPKPKKLYIQKKFEDLK